MDTDLAPVHATIHAVTHAATDDQRRTACQAIVDAYHGELAAGYAWPWPQPMREALRRDVLDAYLRLAATAPPDQVAPTGKRSIAGHASGVWSSMVAEAAVFWMDAMVFGYRLRCV